VEPLERLHERVQGTGTNSSVQSDGEVGGLSAIGSPVLVATGNVGVRSRSCAGYLSRLEKLLGQEDRTLAPFCAVGFNRQQQYRISYGVAYKTTNHALCKMRSVGDSSETVSRRYGADVIVHSAMRN